MGLALIPRLTTSLDEDKPLRHGLLRRKLRSVLEGPAMQSGVFVNFFWSAFGV